MVDSLTKPKLPIAVIVPTFNDGDYLISALESVITQDPAPQQLIVIDDGSEGEFAKRLVKNLSNYYSDIDITYFWKKNGGPSSARNVGLGFVDTEFVTFLDSDDKMLQASLAMMFQALNALPDEYFGVYGTHIDKLTQKVYPYGDHDGCVSTKLVGRKGGVAGGVTTYLFRTNSLRNIGGFDESLVNNEDFDLVIRLLRNNWKCKGIITAVFERNYREDSVSRPHDPYKAYEGVNKFLIKAQENNYFSKREVLARMRGAKYTLAKNLYRNNNKREAKHILGQSVVVLPKKKRDLVFLAFYIYLLFVSLWKRN